MRWNSSETQSIALYVQDVYANNSSLEYAYEWYIASANKTSANFYFDSIDYNV